MYLHEVFGARTPCGKDKGHDSQPVAHSGVPSKRSDVKSRWGKQSMSCLLSQVCPWAAYLDFRKKRCFLRAGSKDEGRDHLSPILMSPEHKAWHPAGDPVMDVFSYIKQRDGDM